MSLNSSAGRFPDGADTDSNCADFLKPASAVLLSASSAGATNIKVASVEGFEVGENIMIDTAANLENAVIAAVGTAGATNIVTPIDSGASVIPVKSVIGLKDGQTIYVDDGSDAERAVIAGIDRFAPTPVISTTAPLKHAHAAGAQVSGTGITLTRELTRAHPVGGRLLINSRHPVRQIATARELREVSRRTPATHP